MRPTPTSLRFARPEALLQLVVIAGPANSGKMPLARKLMATEPLYLVHRDHLRASFEANRPDEWEITLLMGELVRGLLRLERSPLAVAWNLEPADQELWCDISDEFRVPLRWLDVRERDVAAMIPAQTPGVS